MNPITETFKGVYLSLGTQINWGCFSRSASVKGENRNKTLGYECCNSSGCIFSPVKIMTSCWFRDTKMDYELLNSIWYGNLLY